MKTFFIAVGLFCSVLATRAEVRMARVFGDHMVLQREMAVPVWGWAEPGESVTVKFAGQTVTTTADQAGKWLVRLAPMKANVAPQDLVVSGKNVVEYRDVLVGEVWIIGGQSNAESNLDWCDREEGSKAELPLLRVMKVEHVMSRVPATNAPCRWQLCKDGQARNFSAAGYFFCRRLIRDLNVPVGLLDDNWGGSNILFWIPEEGWRMIPELSGELERREREMADYRKRMAVYLPELQQWIEETRKAVAAGGVHERLPDAPGRNEFSFMFNGMVAPVMPYAIRGMLWYQGEFNAGDGPIYYHKMRGLIAGWRQLWGQGEFPCYFVQLPNFERPTDQPAGGDGWAAMREVQRKAMDIPNTGMIVTIDIGEAGDIHPKNKLDVGERLALWALARTYGRELVYRSPFYKEMKVEGEKARIFFDSIGGGLMVGRKEGKAPVVEDKGCKLKRFAIAGADKRWHWAEARIEGETVVVSSPEVKEPVAVRYAYAMNPEGCNLYNKEGLPAAPFRTDNW